MKKENSIQLGIYEKGIPLSLSWHDKFKVAKEAGFDFIEFSIDGLKPRILRLDMPKEELLQIRQTAEEFKMPFHTMALTANRYYPLGDCDEHLRKQGREIVKKAIRVAEILGISIIQIAAYDVNGKESTQETIHNFLTSMNLLTDIAKEKGITLAVEVLEDVPFFSTIQKATEVLQNWGNNDIALYADTGNVASIDVNPQLDLTYDKDRIVACHIKDALIGNCRNVPYGKGIVDFNACMNVFAKKNYSGYFVAEVWSDEDMHFLPYLKDVAIFIRSKMKEECL